MSTWQRGIRLVMLLIFVPTAVLAAKPLTYCVSAANAHRAVEYVYLPGPGHHNIGEREQTAPRIVDKGAVAATSTSDDTCVDISVLIAVQAEDRKNDTKPPAPVSAGKVLVPIAELVPEASQACLLHMSGLRIARVLHPQLTELSVTKLLN